ncbi:MAG: hypothetical protein LBT52_00180 [Clostridiales Family XIII bacterium]|jgi:hypothetical protein|nr:hypothetical protein [Clostridiales Family XIII bacterium]
MLFFDVKRVLITVAIIVGIMAVVICGFLYAAGFFSLDKKDALYQGMVAPQYLTATATAIAGEPMDEETIADLEDTDDAKGTVGLDVADGAGNASAGTARDNIRVLLFLGSGEIAASGNVSAGNDKFSLMKTVNMLNVDGPGDFLHMNKDRDMLTNGEVEAILADGGYFRLASGDKFISDRIQPASS